MKQIANYAALGLIPLVLAACASTKVAKDLRYVSFEEKNQKALQSVGTIEGRDCKWSVLGYRLGEEPSVRVAFQNAMEQRDGNFIPGQDLKKKGDSLKEVKNITVEQGGLNLWVVGRQCIIITGAGYL